MADMYSHGLAMRGNCVDGYDYLPELPKNELCTMTLLKP